MGQPSHMVLGMPNVNWPPQALVLWVVGFLGRPYGGEGGKLLGESGNLGVLLRADLIRMIQFPSP